LAIKTASASATTNGKQCGDGGIVTATGSFTTNGAGGTVSYFWIRKDDTGTHVQPTHTLAIAKGDTSSHPVVTDQWTPNSSGSEQLVFVSPTYPLAAKSFNCGG
jgi:hypothetical protein